MYMGFIICHEIFKKWLLILEEFFSEQPNRQEPELVSLFWFENPKNLQWA
jgi:hypothetical protein